MRAIIISLLYLLVAACVPARPGRGDGVSHPSPAPAATSAAVPAGAAGKISATQVGRITPVPAFRGGGNDWQIEIRAIGDLRHDVKLYWGGHAQSAGGSLVYDAARDAATHDGTIVLDGTLNGAQGDAAMQVLIERRDCSDAYGHGYRHSVQVTVAGMATMQGCGELAMY